jgi:WD40 repeat protein
LLAVPSEEGFTALHETIRECVRHINCFHINVNDLEAAAYAQCCFQMMEYLLEKGASVDTVDHQKNSPLCTCAKLGGPGAVDVGGWLLDHDVNLEHKNAEGKTPFFIALEHGNGDIATLLREMGCDQNAVDEYGITPKQNSQFFNRITALLYCENWPKDYFDFLKESKMWTGCEAHNGIERQSRKLTPVDKNQLGYLEDLFKSQTWKFGYTKPVEFMEFHNPESRDYESPFDILDFEALGSLLYYDMMWVTMDDEGRQTKAQLEIDCGLYFLPVAKTSWRCTWTGKLLGSDGAAEWILPGGMRPLHSFKAHERGITTIQPISNGVDGGRSVMASIADDPVVKLWYMPAVAEAGYLKGHVEKVTCIVANGNSIFTGSVDRTVRQWTLNHSIECSAVLCGHEDTVTCLAVDSANMWLVSGGQDGALRVWHIPSKICMAIFQCDKGVASTAAGGFPKCIILDEKRSCIYAGLGTGDLQMWNLHQNLLPIKRPNIINRTKPKLLLPDKPDEIVEAARKNVDIKRGSLVPVSKIVFDTWDKVDPEDDAFMVPGCTYVYELRIKNFGAPLKNMIIKDLLETGMTYVGCNPVEASIYIERGERRSAVLWKVDSLPLAAEARLKVCVVADIQGNWARATRLIHGRGLALLRLTMIRGQLHCGFQGGDIRKLNLKFEAPAVRLAQMLNVPAEDDDPWVPRSQRWKCATKGEPYCCHKKYGTTYILLLRALLCAPCLLYKKAQKCCSGGKVQPAEYNHSKDANGKKPDVALVDSHYFHQMTDQVGDLEKSLMVTGLNGDGGWTSFAVGKEVHSVRGTGKNALAIKNYHPITTRTLQMQKDTLAIGYSDGIVRIWPVLPPTSWEAKDILIVFAIDLLYALLLLTISPFLWRFLPILATLFCSIRKKNSLSRVMRRRLILDGAMAVLLDGWAAWLFLLYVLLLPGRPAIKAAWRLTVADCRDELTELDDEVLPTIWNRLQPHISYLATLAGLSSERFLKLNNIVTNFIQVQLYGGHAGRIVCLEIYGALLYSLSVDGVISEWKKDAKRASRIWYGRSGVTCLCFQPLNESLTTMWVGFEDGNIDVRSLKNGEIIATFSGSHGSVRYLTPARINDHKSIYTGWTDGSILNVSLSLPKTALNIRDVEVGPELPGHTKPISGLIVRDEKLYSYSHGRVLAHSMVTHKLAVIFNEADLDMCCAVEFFKKKEDDLMFMGAGVNILVFDVPQSFHRKDEMQLNETTIEASDGTELTAKTGKLANVLEGHQGLVTTLTVVGDSIYSGSTDGTIREWKVAYPWECISIFDTKSTRINQVALTKGSLFCSLPDGVMQAWKHGEAFLPTNKGDEGIVGGTKLGATTTGTLGKLLRAAKAAQRDVTDITYGPRSGRAVEVDLERPTAVTQVKTFRHPTLDDRVFIGMENGDICVLGAQTAEVVRLWRSGRRNSIGWLFLEVLAVAIYLLQMIGLGFCIDNTLWSHTGAGVRDALGPAIFRSRGYHAPAFLPNFAAAVSCAAAFVVVVVLQVQTNALGRWQIRAQLCTYDHVQQVFAGISGGCWLFCWLGTYLFLVPVVRALAATFVCKFECWQGKHLAFCVAAGVAILVFVPFVSRMVRVHGDVYRLAPGRLAVWAQDNYRDDHAKFLPSFAVNPKKIWCLSALVWAKAAAAILSTTIVTPSLNACVLCLVCFCMLGIFTVTLPFKKFNANLVFIGSFLAIGGSYAATLVSAWVGDWQWDRPAVLVLLWWAPVLAGPVLVFNPRPVARACWRALKFSSGASSLHRITVITPNGAVWTDRWMKCAGLLACVSPAAFQKRRRKVGSHVS